LTVCKFSYGSWSWNEADDLDLAFCILGFTGSKFSHGCWSWNEADGLALLLAFLASQQVSSLMVTGAGMKLMVLICCWHYWLDSW
jgi:hypothetical protein